MRIGRCSMPDAQLTLEALQDTTKVLTFLREVHPTEEGKVKYTEILSQVHTIIREAVDKATNE